MRIALPLILLLAACEAPPEVGPPLALSGPPPQILPMEEVLAAAGQPGAGAGDIDARAAALRARAARLRAE